MQISTSDHRLEGFITTCRRHGLKITPQRVAIYQALMQSNRHPSADAIFRDVQKDHPHISFDTVNRTLATLAEIGLIDVVEVFGGPKRFDPDTGDHHHLHCMDCGRIIDLDHEDGTRMDVPAVLARKFKVVSQRVVLKGLCEKCQSAS